MRVKRLSASRRQSRLTTGYGTIAILTAAALAAVPAIAQAATSHARLWNNASGTRAGSTWSLDGISCTIAAKTVTCKNRSGHGFTISRTRDKKF